jgi:hypothetical protein
MSRRVVDHKMAQDDVKYKQIWQCQVCQEKFRMPKDAWDGWTKTQRASFIDELQRRHLVHPV